PDVSVVCRQNPQTDAFQDEPAAIFEVLSRSTRRIDEGEKKDAYLTIPSLSVYALIEQESAVVVVFRRTEHGVVREAYEGLDAIRRRGGTAAARPRGNVYKGVESNPNQGEEDPAGAPPPTPTRERKSPRQPQPDPANRGKSRRAFLKASLAAGAVGA